MFNTLTDKFLNFLQYEKRYSNHTLKAYKKDLSQFSNFLDISFEIKVPSKVEHVHVRNWVIDLMESGISPNSVNRKIACLKSYFKFLNTRFPDTHNPAARIKPLKSEKYLPSFVNEDDMNTLLDRFPFEDNFHGQRDKLLLELLYCTGIRVSELIELKLSNVDFNNSYIRVLGKRNKERILPVSRAVLHLIKRNIDISKLYFDQKYDYLLITDSGKKLYPMFIYRIVKKYLTLVTTATKKSPHILRHTFATHLLNRGAEINAIKDLLGHTSLAATQVYTHNTLGKLKTAFDQAHPKA